MGDTSWLVLARAHGIPLAVAARQASFFKPRAAALGAPLPSFCENLAALAGGDERREVVRS